MYGVRYAVAGCSVTSPGRLDSLEAVPSPTVDRTPLPLGDQDRELLALNMTTSSPPQRFRRRFPLPIRAATRS